MLSRSSILIYFSFILSLAVSFHCKAQAPGLEQVPDAFERIPDGPLIYHFRNTKIRIPAGGHLQGIQGWTEKNNEYAILTSSSASISWCAVAGLTKQGEPGNLLQLDTLSGPPFRHAGGCQLDEGNLVVGLEDNYRKNRSKVILASFSGTGELQTKKEVVDRKGFYKRSTAGATGITKTTTGQYLVAVGDWDSKSIDFYISRPGSTSLFDSISTVNKTDTGTWLNWQSINLLCDKDGQLFLLGFARSGISNKVQLFQLQITNKGSSLHLVSTRSFHCLKGASFRYGSGIRVLNNHELAIYACPRKLKKNTAVCVFRH